MLGPSSRDSGGRIGATVQPSSRAARAASACSTCQLGSVQEPRSNSDSATSSTSRRAPPGGSCNSRPGSTSYRWLARYRRWRSRAGVVSRRRSEEHTSELQSLMRISYAVFCLKKKKQKKIHAHEEIHYHLS